MFLGVVGDIVVVSGWVSWVDVRGLRVRGFLEVGSGDSLSLWFLEGLFF